MTSTTELLPISQTATPQTAKELQQTVADAYQSDTPIYTIGGGTSLSYGRYVSTKKGSDQGIGLETAELNQIIDYPSRDMTITLQAGMTMSTLEETLRENSQCLPIDVPQSEKATVGAVVATNFNGPRRYGLATIRDYVIGISAVDGRGVLFSAGGRVVKNVAGYDLCKLLTGSMGTLGVITQITLKVRPIIQSDQLVTCDLADWESVESVLAQLVNSNTTPSAIELYCGPRWKLSENIVAKIAVRLEGTNSEVQWMVDTLQTEWKQQGIDSTVLGDETAAELWSATIEFPAEDKSAMVLKANVVPSATTNMIKQFQQVDKEVEILAHAGTGIIFARYANADQIDMAQHIISHLRTTALAAHGDVVVLAHDPSHGLTRQAIFGSNENAVQVMRNIKEQFDPKDILNRGRYLF